MTEIQCFISVLLIMFVEILYFHFETANHVLSIGLFPINCLMVR